MVSCSSILCRCLGASTHLKNKYGSGYLLEVKLTIKDQSTSLDDRLEGLHQYIISKFPGASMMEQFSERVQYKVPKSSVTSLSRAFTVLEEGEDLWNYEIRLIFTLFLFNICEVLM